MARPSTWDPALYLRFEQERNQPARDLISRLDGGAPERIVDLGCGTGTSTSLLRERWPQARLVGLDSSTEMIAAARSGPTAAEWVVGDIRTWSATEPVGLIFSNAALHWVPDHATLFPHLVEQLVHGGALAVQMPVNSESGAHRAIRDVTGSPAWASRWPGDRDTSRVEAPEEYYRLLAPRSASIAIWQTEYVHVLPDPAAILEWVKGTTLRPYLTALPSEAERTEFLREVGERIDRAYPLQPDGRVLFPFRRLFLIARR